MDKVFAFLQVNALALLCFLVAGSFWKSYFEAPHRHLERGDLVETTGPVKAMNGLVSLPSGSGAGTWLLLRDPERQFSLPTGLAYQTGKDGLTEGSEVTVAFSPEVDPTKVQAEAFSLRWKGKDYLDPDTMIASYNRHVAKMRQRAILTTLAGFAALGLVWVIRKVIFPRVFGRK